MSSAQLKLVWPAQKLEFALQNTTLRIGRNTHNDIQIPDQLVSGQHAMIRDGKLLDRSSTNGTFINDVEVPKGVSTQLNPGDLIKFGDTEIRVEEGPVYSATNAPDEDEASSSSGEGSSDEEGVPDMIRTSTKRPGLPAGGPSWFQAQGAANGADPADVVAERAAGGGGGDGNADVEGLKQTIKTLQNQCTQLRNKNMKLMQTNNPRKLQMERRRIEREHKEEVENLKFQILYGKEEQEEELIRLRHEARTHESDKKQLEKLAAAFDDERKNHAETQKRLHELLGGGIGAGGGGGGGGGGVDPKIMRQMVGELVRTRGSVERLSLAVVLFISVMLFAGIGFLLHTVYTDDASGGGPKFEL